MVKGYVGYFKGEEGTEREREGMPVRRVEAGGKRRRDSRMVAVV